MCVEITRYRNNGDYNSISLDLNGVELFILAPPKIQTKHKLATPPPPSRL
jgi:hypothetical protein